MAGTVASVVTQTFAGLTADGKRIYNVKAVMTATVAEENKTTIGVTRLKKILTPSFAIVGNDVGSARYVTDTSTDGHNGYTYCGHRCYQHEDTHVCRTGLRTVR